MDNDDDMIRTGCTVPYIHLFCTVCFYLPFNPWMAHLSQIYTHCHNSKKGKKSIYMHIYKPSGRKH